LQNLFNFIWFIEQETKKKVHYAELVNVVYRPTTDVVSLVRFIITVNMKVTQLTGVNTLTVVTTKLHVWTLRQHCRDITDAYEQAQQTRTNNVADMHFVINLALFQTSEKDRDHQYKF